MSNTTKIQWADATWNPVTGCTRVSAGCDHCYAVGQSHRLEKMTERSGDAKTHARYRGLTVLNKRGDRHFNGEVRCHEDRLPEALKFKAGDRVFVNSMSDLFHERVPFEFVDKVLAMVALRPDVTFMVLTKRPARMREYFSDRHRTDAAARDVDNPTTQTLVGCTALGVCCDLEAMGARGRIGKEVTLNDDAGLAQWPLENLWLGVSAEDQAAADARIPDLLATPAAVRFVSYEPALGPVKFPPDCFRHFVPNESLGRNSILIQRDSRLPGYSEMPNSIQWIIVGGESGPHARPFDIAWARSTVAQCKAAGIACFVKQMGARPMRLARCELCGEIDDVEVWDICGADEGNLFCPACNHEQEPVYAGFAAKKGDDPAEWPEDLRVQQHPRPRNPRETERAEGGAR